MIREVRRGITLSLVLVAMSWPVGAEPARPPQAGSVVPDLGKKWEVGFQAGYAFIEVPSGGSANLLPPGVPFTAATGLPSRYVSSWSVGDGALLLNQVLQGMGLPERVVPLDLVAYGSSIERKNGASFGFRFGRQITSRLSAELIVDYSRAHLALSPAALAVIDTTRTSLDNAWTAAITNPVFSNVSVTSDVDVNEPGGRMLTTGVISFALKRSGRIIPYVSGGAGVLNRVGGAASATLQTRYGFTLLGSPIDESDTVVFEAALPGFVGVFGGGARYYLSPRWGFRGDVLVYVGGSQDNELSLSPNVVTVGTTGIVIASITNPSFQFSNVTPNTASTPRSSLTGPDVPGYRTFDRSGDDPQLNVTLGLFWRF